MPPPTQCFPLVSWQVLGLAGTVNGREKQFGAKFVASLKHELLVDCIQLWHGMLFCSCFGWA